MVPEFQENLFDVEFATAKVGGDGRFLLVGFRRLVSGCFPAFVICVGISHYCNRVRDPVCILFGVVSSPDGL